MKRNLLRACCLLVASLLGGCHTSGASNGQPLMANADLCVEKSEVPKLEKRVARDHDAEAALRLSQHYGLCVFDYQRERFWLQKSADFGNAHAQYNLAFELSDGGNARLSSARYQRVLRLLNTAERTTTAENNQEFLGLIRSVRSRVVYKREHPADP